MSDSIVNFLRSDVAADKAGPKGPQNNYDSGQVPLGAVPGVELHQELGPEGKGFYQLSNQPPAKEESGQEAGIQGVGGTRTRPKDYYAPPAQSAAHTGQRAPTPEEMMRMADELEQDMVDQHDRSLIHGSYIDPSKERDQTTDLYVPSKGYAPPEWLAKYMENVPTTGTTMLDPIGLQRYSQDKERLKKLKAQQKR